MVEAPLDVRLDRLETRGVARDDAERRMAAQATDEERREVATHVIDNGGDLEALAAPGRRGLGRPARDVRTADPGITVTPRR